MPLMSDVKFKEKLTCGFKMTWEIWWIFTQPLKSPKIPLRWAILSKVCEVCAKKIQRSYLLWHWTVMQNLKNPDLVVSKMAWGIGWTFTIRAPKSLKLYIDGFFLPKAYTVSARNFQRNYVSWHWRILQSLNENWLVGWKMHFDWIHLSKAYKYLHEKERKSYVSWHWRVMQSLKKNWLLVPKMTWGIWWILMRAVASLEICTLMCYFCQ